MGSDLHFKNQKYVSDKKFAMLFAAFLQCFAQEPTSLHFYAETAPTARLTANS
jgi:hypothetical protein